MKGGGILDFQKGGILEKGGGADLEKRGGYGPPSQLCLIIKPGNSNFFLAYLFDFSKFIVKRNVWFNMKHNTSISLNKCECTEAGLGWNVTMGRYRHADLPTFQSLKPVRKRQFYGEEFKFRYQFTVRILFHTMKLWHSSQNPDIWLVWCCISVFCISFLENLRAIQNVESATLFKIILGQKICHRCRIPIINMKNKIF